jgi:cell division protein FtsA
MEGVIELAEEIFHMPVRLGMPQYVSGLSDVVSNPIHATGVGLLLYGEQHRHSKMGGHFIDDAGFKGAWGRLKSWFQGNF